MNLRFPRHLTLLALVAPALAVPLTVSVAGPAAAERPDEVASAYVVDEWTRSGVKLPPGTYTAVEVAYDATFGITLDGQVRAGAGYGGPHVLQPPQFDRPVVDVTAGTTFGIAIDDLGQLRTWGDGSPVPDEDMAETYRDVEAVGGAAIGVTTDGELRYWGAREGTFDEAEVAASDIVSVSLNSDSAVALTSDGRILSAGYALDGTYFQSSPFPADRADETFVAVDAGVFTAVALTDDGEIVTWGSYQNGEDQVPALPAGRRAVAVSAGMWMSAAVLDDGSVIRWGSGEHQVLPPVRAGLQAVDVDVDRYRALITYAALENVTAPTISGTPQFGTELTATPGEWSDTPDDVHYEWTLHTGGDAKVVGTDSATYTPTAADALAGGTLEVAVTAERSGFVGASATSRQTAPVARRTFATAPVVTVGGTPRVGGTLTATASGTTPAADTTAYAWFTRDGAALTPIAGATGGTLELTPGLVGRSVVARATSSRNGYVDVSADSAPVPVAAATLGAPGVTVTGSTRVGQLLTGSVTADRSATTAAYQWLRGTTPVPGATSTTYQVSGADLGHTLSMRVTSSAPGHHDASATSAPTARVTLPATTLRVKAPKKVAAGSKAVLKVSGLAGGETVTVTVRGTRVTASANAAGVATVKVKVTGKTGRRVVKVTGSMADRAGTTTLKVVRPRR
ncbi:hypothetical protein F4692_003395 [Nocardioides cavernae]|uniref:Uncharacterized protein n=1 Tax=Nocardioides cavernae TaxID=1921566 RepID=A0A7Y9KU54_9ACTN|nr:hypothetical protein [Nocardioides cavernae]NYE38247.1 hypothetical protein [Nocardioides cavernae]